MSSPTVISDLNLFASPVIDWPTLTLFQRVCGSPAVFPTNCVTLVPSELTLTVVGLEIFKMSELSPL